MVSKGCGFDRQGAQWHARVLDLEVLRHRIAPDCHRAHSALDGPVGARHRQAALGSRAQRILDIAQ